MFQDIYEQIVEFYDVVEQEYDRLFADKTEWEAVHLCYLHYYLIRYNVIDERDFIIYHFRTAYRLFLEKSVINRDLISY
ncbi:sigma(X)-activator ComW [Streptococcus oralis]|uniref:Competence positive regulator ComW n=1 Tax=Streptococcus oralis TaxID=1303 RepID=A0A139PCT3_STROR|nr:Competence positive regulator ComW [Streptococcus oralis]